MPRQALRACQTSSTPTASIVSSRSPASDIRFLDFRAVLDELANRSRTHIVQVLGCGCSNKRAASPQVQIALGKSYF
jgi:hypothetical protein